jgi:cytidylate kinase
MTAVTPNRDRHGSQRVVIAIDGPAGSGKSTVAKRLAAALGHGLLDTGAIYRSLALAASKAGIAWDDATALAALAARLEISFHFDGQVNRVLLGGRDVTQAIRTPEMSDGASRVAALPAVRAALLGVQRRLAAANGVVAEGRDIGTVVLPDADLKVFLTADLDERARRRQLELEQLGPPTSGAAASSTPTASSTAAASSLAPQAAELAARDARDARREVAPLRVADGALVIDTTTMAVDEVVERILAELAGR